MWTQTAVVDAHRAANLQPVSAAMPPQQKLASAVSESAVLPPKHIYKPARKTKGPPRGPRGPYKPRKLKIPLQDTPKQDLPICSPAWSIGSIDGHPIYGPVPSIPPSPAVHNAVFSPGQAVHNVVFSPGQDSLNISPVPPIDEVVNVTPVIEFGLQSPASTIGYSDSNSTEMDDDIVELDLDDKNVDIITNDVHPLFDKSELLRSLGEKIGKITSGPKSSPHPVQSQKEQTIKKLMQVVDEVDEQHAVNNKCRPGIGEDESINGVYLPIPTLDDYTVIPCTSSDDSSPSCSDTDETLNLQIDQAIIDDIFGLDVDEIDPDFNPEFDRALPTDEVPRVGNEMVIRSPPIHKDIAPTEKKFCTKDRMERYENQKT